MILIDDGNTDFTSLMSGNLTEIQCMPLLTARLMPPSIPSWLNKRDKGHGTQLLSKEEDMLLSPKKS